MKLAHLVSSRLLFASVLATLCALIAPSPARAQSAWGVTTVAADGQNGFTRVLDISIGESGKIAVRGTRGADTGIYLVAGPTITPVAIVGAELPAALGKVTSFGKLRVDPLGRVIFEAGIEGFLDVARLFRWDNGVVTRLPLAETFETLITGTRMTSDGRWIAEQFTTVQGLRRRTISLIDGLVSSAVVVVDQVNDFPVRTVDFLGLAIPNASGAIALLRETTAPLGVPQRTFSTDILLFAPGNATPAVAGNGALNANGDTEPVTKSGTLVTLADFNDAGMLLFTRDTFAQPATAGFRRDLVVLDALGERVLIQVNQEVGPVFSELRPIGLDGTGRVAFWIRKRQGTSDTRDIYAGPDLVNDRVIGIGDKLLGQAVKFINTDTIRVTNPAGTFADKRVFLFEYMLADDSTGWAIATKDVTRWINPAGGAWSTAANWNPATVPAAGVSTLFDLEASYDVNVGTVSSGRASIENGSVGFRPADLTLIGAITIGGDATLTMPGGSLHAGEMVVGHLPPLSVPVEPTARFNASETTLSITVDQSVVVGNAGHGEMTVTQGKVISSELRIGSGSEGTVNLGMDGTDWLVRGSVAVGHTALGKLNVERGAGMRVNDSFVIGVGTPPPKNGGGGGGGPLSRGPRDIRTMDAGDEDFVGGWTVVDNAGSTRLPAFGNIFVVGALTVGALLPGQLDIRNGGEVAVAGGVPDSIQTAQAPVDGFQAEARIVISGTGPNAAEPSRLITFGDAALGLGAETLTVVQIETGGAFIVSEDLALAVAPNSIANVLLGGVAANGARSTLEVLRGPTTGEGLIIGKGGNSTVAVRDGALLTARDIYIGQKAGSRGTLYVGGRARGQVATVRVTSTSPSIIGGILVGGFIGAGGDSSAPGELILNDAEVEAPIFSVAPAGVVRGQGRIVVEGIMDCGGTIDPAFNLEPPLVDLKPESLAQSQSSPRSLDAEGGSARALSTTSHLPPGTLTIQGNVVMKPTARVVLDVIGSAPGAADRIVVQGALTLGGTLQLNFSNGYAPRAGDTLDLITSTSATGAFATTTVTGLAPGFQFTLAPNGAGGVRLTAVNNAVASTAVGSRLANLSVRTPLAEAQNLIVGFVVQGGAKPVLVRAAGPGLSQFLSGSHPDPRITLFDGAGVSVDANDSWPAALAPIMQTLGAFPFASASNDAALQSNASAAYTAHVNGPGAGIVLVELYDAQTGNSPRLVNASARNRVGTGDGVLVAGFVIDGAGSKTVLVRAIGPTLSGFGVPSVLADPLLTVFNGTGTQIAQNDNWPDSLAPIFATVGAFGLTNGTKDSALLITLAPGVYTAQVSGVGGATGEALVEIYEVP